MDNSLPNPNNNLVLHHLQAIREAQEKQQSALESINVALHALAESNATRTLEQVRTDHDMLQVQKRLERIERRLELSDGQEAG